MNNFAYDVLKQEYSETIVALRSRASALRELLYSADCVYNKKTRRRFFRRIKSLEDSALDMEFSISCFEKYCSK